MLAKTSNSFLRRTALAATAVLGLLTAGAATAEVIVLDFTGVATTGNSTTVGGFYNGGVSGNGNSGTNYGVEFSDNALAINGYNGCCEPDAPTPGILFFLSGGAVTMNFAAGFTTGFSFYYSSNSAAFINVYDGLNGTGNVLATLSLALQANTGCPAGASGFYCNWDPIGVAFAGVARSIDFGGGANFVAYDLITFGSQTPGNREVPEPGTLGLAALGLGLMGWVTRSRRANRRDA